MIEPADRDRLRDMYHVILSQLCARDEPAVHKPSSDLHYQKLVRHLAHHRILKPCVQLEHPLSARLRLLILLSSIWACLVYGYNQIAAGGWAKVLINGKTVLDEVAHKRVLNDLFRGTGGFPINKIRVHDLFCVLHKLRAVQQRCDDFVRDFLGQSRQYDRFVNWSG